MKEFCLNIGLEVENFVKWKVIRRGGGGQVPFGKGGFNLVAHYDTAWHVFFLFLGLIYYFDLLTFSPLGGLESKATNAQVRVFLDPLQANVPFPYLLKMSENLKLSYVSRGI